MSAEAQWIVRRGKGARRLLFLLHGNAQEEGRFAAYGELLDPTRRYALIVPRGPLEAELFGQVGYGWYRVGPDGPEPETFFPALERTSALLDRACDEHGFAREQALIAGFCQGAALGLAIGLGSDVGPPPAGILFMSGYLASPPGMRYREARDTECRVLGISGTSDRVIDPERQERALRAIEAQGFPVERRAFPMGHQVTLESLAAARDWLGRFVQSA